MYPFTPKPFSFPKLKGISQKTMDEHIKLYNGYIDNANHIYNIVEKHDDILVAQNLVKALSFEYDGIRNHELFFHQLISPKSIDNRSLFAKAIDEEYGSFQAFLDHLTLISMSRGIGWTMVYYDPHSSHVFTTWVSEQQNGVLQNAHPLLALDMWEHAYINDFSATGRKEYIKSLITNIDWSVPEERYFKIANKAQVNISATDNKSDMLHAVMVALVSKVRK